MVVEPGLVVYLRESVVYLPELIMSLHVLVVMVVAALPVLPVMQTVQPVLLVLPVQME
jgi:hypothetical protein